MKLKQLFKILFILLLTLYPVFVYLGFNYFSMGKTILFILFVFSIRAFYLRKSNSPLGKMSFIVILLTIAFGLIGLIIDRYNLIKLYPILINLGLACLFTYSLKGEETPIIEVFARLKEKNLPLKAIRYTRTVTKVWIAFFIFNTLVSSYTYFYVSMENWTLYNGLISYILIGLLFLGEYSVRLWLKSKWDKEYASKA